jgi:hypothetical protein
MNLSKFFRPGIVGAATLMALMAASPAFAICSAQGLELMRNLAGSWRGKGAVTPIGGAPEFITCRISYSMGGADIIQQVIACAGSDYKIEASSRVTCEGNRLEGLFEENIAHSTGLVQGSIGGGHLTIEAESAIFKGIFNVTFQSASSHLVAITQFDSAKGRQVPIASIQLKR